MGYPNYPNNRLIVNGVDLTEKFKMVLVDGYTLSPPSPKTYTVDIPGGNGKLDLTEALIGDIVYGNRKQEFIFYAINTENFEKLKTEVSNFLHGQAFYYQMTMDPEYTYHGRFTVSSYSHSKYTVGVVGTIKIKIEADPFKFKKAQIVKVNAVGGQVLNLKSGRMSVRPMIETDGFTKIIYNNKLETLSQGTWDINDFILTEGDNEVYVNSFDIRNLKWKELKTDKITWGDFKKQRLFEWYKYNGNGVYANKTWANLAEANVLCENLLPFPYSCGIGEISADNTDADLVVSAKNDGRIIVNGINNVRTDYEIKITTENTKFELEAGDYIISGIGSYENKVATDIYSINKETLVFSKDITRHSWGSSNTFTITEDEATNNYFVISIFINGNTNVTYNNYEIKPMLEKGSTPHAFVKPGIAANSPITWLNIRGQTWADQLFKADVTGIIKNVVLKYDWGDI